MRATLAMMAAALALPLGCAEAEPEPGPRAEATPLYESSKQVSTMATVTAMDVDKRKVTLKGPYGNVITCQVDDSVRNLSAIEVGDRVAVTYVEAMAVEVVKKTSDSAEQVVVERSAEGEKPAGKATRESAVTAEVLSIDRGHGTITVQIPSGEITTVAVRRPERLSALKVGDLLRVTYRESVAMMVEKAPDEVR
ncbi:MAG TPA: hypothetical protein VF950_25040 [Planctomycetota bacterium]